MFALMIRYLGVVGVLCVAAAGCTPCAPGFSRGDEGICYANSPCPEGYFRNEDLRCDPVEQSDRDQAESAPLEQESLGTDGATDTGFFDAGGAGPPDGFGRIFIRYSDLSGLPMHGFFVMGTAVGEQQPTSGYCQVILAASVDVEGAMVVFDGMSQDCPLPGDVALHANGEVQLFMQVAAGAAADPVLCDERVVEVDGDTVVDFGDVIDCGR